MTRTRSTDEVRQQYLDAMGPDLGTTFHLLWNDVTWLHYKWAQYRKLYGTDPERIALLNRSAGTFFGVVQDVLWDDIQLHICRLTDPSSTRGRTNLTISRLPELISPACLRSEVDTKIKLANEAVEAMRKHRNRRLAHNDLDRLLRKGPYELPGLSRATTEKALEAVRDVMNTVDLYYRESTTAYEEAVGPGADADTLLWLLRQVDSLKIGK